MTRVVLKSATVVYRGGPRATDGEAVATPWSVCVQKTDAHPLGGVPITFLQTSLDRKRRLVSWDDEGKGMRFREAEREAEWVGAEEQARQEQMPWPESMTGRAGVGGLARWVRRWVSLACQASFQRSLQTEVRKASMGLTWAGANRSTQEFLDAQTGASLRCSNSCQELNLRFQLTRSSPGACLQA